MSHSLVSHLLLCSIVSPIVEFSKSLDQLVQKIMSGNESPISCHEGLLVPEKERVSLLKVGIYDKVLVFVLTKSRS